MNLPRSAHAIVLVASLLPRPLAVAQQSAHPKSPPDTSSHSLKWSDLDKAGWANAKPYLDASLPDLQAAVPELQGLDPAKDQDALPSLLNGVGQKCIDLLRMTPNVISREEVVTQTQPHGKRVVQQFDYLLLRHEGSTSVMLDEYRTESHDQSGGSESVVVPSVRGFASSWVRLYPTNRGESRFRYLGRQRVGQHMTMVVAFAQIPGAVKYPGQFVFGGLLVSLLYQGVAWIDASDFRILRLREDLLAPRPDIGLEKLTAVTDFEEVRIAQASSLLWLPKTAVITWEYSGKVVQQKLSYSHYRLYAAKSKIIVTPP